MLSQSAAYGLSQGKIIFFEDLQHVKSSNLRKKGGRIVLIILLYYQSNIYGNQTQNNQSGLCFYVLFSFVQIILQIINNLGMQSSDSQKMVIVANKAPMRSANIYHMLLFEWGLFLYQVYLLASIMGSGAQYQLRILLYCVIFLLFYKLEMTYRYLQLEDPLHLLAFTKSIRYLIYLCLFNLSLLLLRIVIENHNLHAFIIFIHYLVTIVLFLNDLSKKNTKLDINVDHNTVISKMITPLFLFMFNRTSNSPLTEFWLVEYIIFGANLLVSEEITRILLLKECQYLGWVNYEDKGKTKSSWNKQRSLRSIIVICCILIVTQNLLLIFQKIKYEISITILHTFIIAILSYFLYTGYLPGK